MKRIKGRGYVDTGGSVISEFYTPLVPKGYDFLRKLATCWINRSYGKKIMCSLGISIILGFLLSDL